MRRESSRRTTLTVTARWAGAVRLWQWRSAAGSTVLGQIFRMPTFLRDATLAHSQALGHTVMKRPKPTQKTAPGPLMKRRTSNTRSMAPRVQYRVGR